MVVPLPMTAAAAAAAAGGPKSVRFREEVDVEEAKDRGGLEEEEEEEEEEEAPPPPPPPPPALRVGSSEGLSGEFTPSYNAYTPSARTMHDLR
jgi:hypothetical protein